MSDYSKTTNFTAKDNLATLDPLKVIKGALFDTEFDDIVTAVATKFDSTNLATQAEAEAGANNVALQTPLRAEQHVVNWAKENDSMVFDLQQLNLGADALIGWDQSATNLIGFVMGDGLEFNGTNFRIKAAMAGAGMTHTSGVLNVIGGNGITANANDIAISSSAAGAGMTFTTGVLDVIGGDGITANANDIEVDSTVIRTTGTASMVDVVVTETIKYTGVITPTELGSGSSTDNYAPTGFADATMIRISAGGTASLTGLAGGADGRIVYLMNIGAFSINLLDENASSTAANRFRTVGSGQGIAENGGMILIYDGVSNRWRTTDPNA